MTEPSEINYKAHSEAEMLVNSGLPWSKYNALNLCLPQSITSTLPRIESELAFNAHSDAQMLVNAGLPWSKSYRVESLSESPALLSSLVRDERVETKLQGVTALALCDFYSFLKGFVVTN